MRASDTSRMNMYALSLRIMRENEVYRMLLGVFYMILAGVWSDLLNFIACMREAMMDSAEGNVDRWLHRPPIERKVVADGFSGSSYIEIILATE